MAGIKEIRVKIKSVQNTRKITKAMEMVAASKMKKAQERMRAGPSVRAAHPEHRDARGARQHRVPSSAADAARRGEERRRRRHHDRQGALRRPEHQPAARGAQPAQGVAREGHRGRVLHDRQQGPRLRQPHGRQDRLAGRQLRRPAGARAPDRPGQDADRRLPRGTARRGAHLLEPLRQHDEAGARSSRR